MSQTFLRANALIGLVAQASSTVEGSWQMPGRGTLLTLLVYVVGEAISIVYVLKILTSEKTPQASLLWIAVILVWPYLGLVLYYLFPHRLHLRRLRRRKSRPPRRGGVRSPASGEAPGETAQRLARFFERLEPDRAATGNQLTLLDTGQGFFTDLAMAIRAARSFVHVEAYILRPDATGQRLLALLEEAAARGVEVRLLYDHIGSWALRDHHVAALRQAGGQAVSYLPLLWRRRPFTVNLRNHRKLFVVDGEIAYLGGRNVGEEYELDRFGKKGGIWLDSMLKVRGPGAQLLSAVFAEDWFNAAEEELTDPRYWPEAEPSGSAWLGCVSSGPDRDRSSLRCTLFEMIALARQYIDISSPYLVPDPPILTALEVAAVRGVRIRLHTNGPRVAQPILYHAARSYYRRLLEIGVEITETEGDYNHSKMFIIDRQQLYLGSANLDMRSFALNFEIGALAVDPLLCQTASALFDERRSLGRAIVPDQLVIGRAGRVLDGVCRVLSPVL